MPPDLWSLYGLMYKSRTFEEAVRQIWKDGKISGEMHLGMGEEGIVAGIVSQLIDGDAMALDHRGTPALLMRGVDGLALLREFMGKPDGLCKGQGGHMHLFAPDQLAASSGIVGASGPAAAGFALAAQMLRLGTVSLSFFGDGATSAGMLMEAMNLAVVWRLPVVFICKDNDWAISTPANTAVGGDLLARAEAFGMKAFDVDGTDVMAVAVVAESALQHARSGQGPVFLWAHCVHIEGHFLGDGLLDMVRRPVYSFRKRVWLIIKGLFRKGGLPWRERVTSFMHISRQAMAMQDQTSRNRDPLVQARKSLVRLDPSRLQALEASITSEIEQIASIALQPERGLP
jgi:acetoin:2,6-dichlorophenolindophenol oxidoreductase subunit alpha